MSEIKKFKWVSSYSSFLTILSTIFAIPISLNFVPILTYAVHMEPFSVALFGPAFDHLSEGRPFAVAIGGLRNQIFLG